MASVCKFEPHRSNPKLCKNHKCVYCECKCGYFCRAHFCIHCKKTCRESLYRCIVGDNYELLVQTIFRGVSRINFMYSAYDHLIRPFCIECEKKLVHTVCYDCYFFTYPGYRKLADQNAKCDVCLQSNKIVDYKENKVIGRGSTGSFGIYCESCAKEVEYVLRRWETLMFGNNYVDGEPIIFSLKYGSKIYSCDLCRKSLAANYPNPLSLIAAMTVFQNRLPTDELPVSLQKLVSSQGIPSYTYIKNHDNFHAKDRLYTLLYNSK